jgi:hypothetical protein
VNANRSSAAKSLSKGWRVSAKCLRYIRTPKARRGVLEPFATAFGASANPARSHPPLHRVTTAGAFLQWGTEDVHRLSRGPPSPPVVASARPIRVLTNAGSRPPEIGTCSTTRI